MLLPWPQRELESRAAMILNLADVPGLDVYPSRGFRSYGRNWYFNWPAWMWKPSIVELQRLTSG